MTAAPAAPAAGGASYVSSFVSGTQFCVRTMDPIIGVGGWASVSPWISNWLLPTNPFSQTFDSQGQTCWEITDPDSHPHDGPWYGAFYQLEHWQKMQGYSYRMLEGGSESQLWFGEGTRSSDIPLGPRYGRIQVSNGLVQITAVPSTTVNNSSGTYIFRVSEATTAVLEMPLDVVIVTGPFTGNLESVIPENGELTFNKSGDWVVGLVEQPIRVSYTSAITEATPGEVVTVTAIVENVGTETLTDVATLEEFCPEILKGGPHGIVCVPDASGHCDTTSWNQYVGDLTSGESTTYTLQVTLYSEAEPGLIHNSCSTKAIWNDMQDYKYIIGDSIQIFALWRTYLPITLNN